MSSIITIRRIKLVLLVLGFLSTMMLFFPSLIGRDSDTVYKGYEIAFGVEVAGFEELINGVFKFNFLNLIAYLLPLIAGIVAILVRRGELISLLLFLASSVLLFLVPEFTKITINVLGNTMTREVSWSYSYGLIIAIILSIISALICIYKLVYFEDRK